MVSRIYLVGDVMIGRSFNDVFDHNPEYPIWGNVKSIFHSNDLVIGNLETTLTDSTDPWPNKTFNYKLSPKYANILNDIPFKFLSLANNHSLDYKREGLIDTMMTLDELGIKYTGAGLDYHQVRQPCILKLPNGVNLHILAAADYPDEWAAGIPYNRIKGYEGIWWFDLRNPEELIMMIEKYQKHLKSNDVLMICLHWGPNWEAQVSREKKLSDIGVKIIMGTSAHHIQPYEFINTSVVFYGLGDFIDDYAINPVFRNDIGQIVSIDLDDQGNIVKVNVVYTQISDLQVNML